jgi:hypothetical protein
MTPKEKRQTASGKAAVRESQIHAKTPAKVQAKSSAASHKR